MFRATARAAVLAASLLAVVPAAADDAPDAARIKRAAEQFDLGAAAFKAKRFEEAAQHFEAADEAVPGIKSLRLAIRARTEASHGWRAATLAAQALDRYPTDADTVKLAKETIQLYESLLHKLKVSCASPCVLAVGARAVHGSSTTRWVVYLEPGKTTVNASFFGNTSAKPRTVDAVAGGSSEVRFEPPEPDRPAVVPVPTAAPTGTSTSTAAPEGTVTAEPQQSATGEVGADKPPQTKGIHPAFFGVGLGLTAAAGGVLAWSGVDTLQNPGPDKVRQACAGKGTDCPEYKLGQENQLRTNILVGVTAGVGAATVLLAIFTRWSGSKEPAKAAVLPTVAVTDRGAAFGVTGALR
jgi:hypothetical protein